jgi:hypothetical protein
MLYYTILWYAAPPLYYMLRMRRYMKEGRGSHADSLGNQAIVRPGGIQWLRCGSGIEHAEGGGNPEGANQHGAKKRLLLSHLIKTFENDHFTTAGLGET